MTVIAGDEDCNATRSLLGVQRWGWVLPKNIPSNFLLASCWLPENLPSNFPLYCATPAGPLLLNNHISAISLAVEQVRCSFHVHIIVFSSARRLKAELDTSHVTPLDQLDLEEYWAVQRNLQDNGSW